MIPPELATATHLFRAILLLLLHFLANSVIFIGLYRRLLVHYTHFVELSLAGFVKLLDFFESLAEKVGGSLVLLGYTIVVLWTL